MNTKRYNWIALGMQLLFGAQPGLGNQPGTGLYQQITALLAWNLEGISCGFIQNPATPNVPPANPLVDADFTTGAIKWPATTAASFVAAIATLQTLGTDWQNGYESVVAIKP